MGDRRNRQAGDESDEITKEAIDAGVDAYYRHSENGWPALLVEEIIRAMKSAQSSSILGAKRARPDHQGCKR